MSANAGAPVLAARGASFGRLPMMLLAPSLIVGAAVMLFDPIFQGLAISLMAGEAASPLPVIRH